MISRRRFIGVFFHGILEQRRCPLRVVGSLIASVRASSIDQLVRLHLDAGDVVVDEIAVVTVGGIFEMLADSIDDECLDLGRRHPANGSGTFRLSLEEG